MVEATNQIFKEMLMEHVKISNFRCKKHPQKDIDLFCREDQHFFCSMCIPKHLTHADKIEVCSPDVLMKHYDFIEKELDVFMAKAQEHKDHIQSVR